MAAAGAKCAGAGSPRLGLAPTWYTKEGHQTIRSDALFTCSGPAARQPSPQRPAICPVTLQDRVIDKGRRQIQWLLLCHSDPAAPSDEQRYAQYLHRKRSLHRLSPVHRNLMKLAGIALARPWFDSSTSSLQARAHHPERTKWPVLSLPAPSLSRWSKGVERAKAPRKSGYGHVTGLRFFNFFAAPASLRENSPLDWNC